ncbi:MAG: sugar transferase [Actinobacteria bacterium]|nr:sugar transferase [Actinomycetota bacterium]
MLSPSTASRGYLLRRCASVASLILIDAVSLCVAGIAAAVSPVTVSHTFSPPHILLAVVMLVALFAIHGLYGLRECRRDRRRRALAAAWFLGTALLLSGAGGAWAPAGVILMWVVAVALLTVGRELLDYCLKAVFPLDLESRRTVVVGSERALATFAARVASLPHEAHARIVGIVSEEPPGFKWPRPHGLPLLGQMRDIEAIICRWKPDELVVVDHDTERLHLVELAELCRRRRMTLKLSDLDMRFQERGVSLIPGLGEALFVAASSPPNGLAWAFKRWMDVGLAMVLLILTAPLWAAVAAAIKLTSAGPVFHSAERVGLGQQAFRCLKFRTMRADAEALQADLESLNEADGAIFKIRDDPRVTALGRWLRKLSIDELPQLVNVLRGEMSLIGPRPLPLRDNQLLEAWHRQRHVILPGLTGLWQVNGRSDTSFDEMIRLDLKYIDTWSLRLDLSIAWRTAVAVIRSRGAC